MHVLRNFSSGTALMQQPVYVSKGTSLQEKSRETRFQEYFFQFWLKTLQTESRGISVVTPAFREEIV